ncbi:MAG: hypothetical protein LBI45_07510, partial [Bacteroidales bacterium]|nr:hypothetical protein [Bacteroidales bacterium]
MAGVDKKPHWQRVLESAEAEMRERAAEREVEQKKQVPTTAPVSTQKEVATQQQKVAASNPITQQAQTSAKPTPTQTLPQRPEQQPYTFEKPINYDEYYENINQKKQIDENYLKAKEQEIEYREKELNKKYPILPTTEKKDDNIWSLENLEKHQLEYDKYNVESERVKKEIENHTLRKDIISIYEKEYNKTHRGAVGRKGESVIYDSDLKNPFYRGTQITIEQTIERTLSNPDFLDKAQKFAIEKVGKDEDAKRIKKELENADKGMDNNTFKNQLSKLTSKELEIYNRELEKELIKYNAAIERVYSQVITQSQNVIIDHLRKQNVPEGHIEYILKKGFSSSGIGLLLGGFNKSTLEKQLLQEGLNEFDAGLLTETLATVLSLSIDGATGLFIPGAIVGGLVSKALLSGAKKIALGRIKNLVANKTFKMITTNVAPNVSKFTQSAFSGSGSFSFFAASKEFANQVYQGNGYDFYAIGDAAKKDAILGFLVGGVGFGTGMLAKKINNHVGQVAVKFGVGVPLEAAVFVSPEVIEGIIAGEPIDSKENAQYFIDMAALMVAMRVKHFKGTFGKEINNNNNIEFNQSDIEQINKVGIDGSNFTQMVKNMFRGDKSANNELNLKNLFPNVDKVMRDENVSHETKRKLEYLFYAGNYYEYNKELLDKTEKDIINGSKNLFRYVPQLGDEAFDKTINELRIDGEYLNYILDKKYSELTEGEKIIYKKYRQSLSECVIKYKELNNAALDYAINENIDLFPKEIQSIIYKENLNEVEIEILKDFLNNIYKREDNGFLNEKERKFLNDLKEHLNFTSDAFERLTSKALNGIPIEIKREDNRIDIFDVKGNVVYSKDFENKETADKYEKAAQKMYLDTNGEFQQKINKLINEKTTQTLQITLELCSSKLENGKIIIKEGKTQGHEDMPDGTSVFVIDEQNNFCLVRYYEKYAKPNEQGHKGVFKERIIHKDNIKDLESRNVVDIVLERLNKESELLGKTSIATMEATINVAAQEGLVEIKNFTDAKEGTVVDVVDIDNNIKKGTITKNEQGQNVIQFSDGSEPITDLSNVKTAIKKTFNGKEFIVSSIEDGSFECKMSEEAEANEFIKKFNDSDYSKEYDAKVSEDKETVIISEKKEKQIDTGRQNIINSIIEKINGKRHNELTEEEKDFLNNPDNKEELNAALAEEKELEFIKKHPDGYIDKAKQQQQIERLTEQQAEHFIAIMEENAENAPVLEFTPENWYAQFGEDGMVKTPIGDVQMGENQYLKMQAKGRSTEFGMVKPTLENPDVIIEKQAEQENAERGTKLLFIKIFTNSSGEKYVFFENVTVKQDGMEVSVSSHIADKKAIAKELTNGTIAYNKLANRSEWYLPENQNGQSDIVPTQANFNDKRSSTENIAEKEKFYERLPKNKKTGKIDQNKMSDADVLQYWEYEKGKEYALIVAKQRKEKLGKELEKEQKTLQNDLGDIKQNAKVEKLKAKKAVYDDYITEIAKQKEKQQKEKNEEQKDKNEKKHEKEQSKTQQEALIGIEQQWNDAPKIYGRTITITLPNG